MKRKRYLFPCRSYKLIMWCDVMWCDKLWCDVIGKCTDRTRIVFTGCRFDSSTSHGMQRVWRNILRNDGRTLYCVDMNMDQSNRWPWWSPRCNFEDEEDEEDVLSYRSILRSGMNIWKYWHRRTQHYWVLMMVVVVVILRMITIIIITVTKVLILMHKHYHNPILTLL